MKRSHFILLIVGLWVLTIFVLFCTATVFIEVLKPIEMPMPYKAMLLTGVTMFIALTITGSIGWVASQLPIPKGKNNDR